MLIFPAMAFAQGAPTIQSDKADYAPGELVTLTGGGWQPGESVHINVNDTFGATWSRNVDVTADASGNITDTFNLPNSFVSDYDVTATGAQSGTARTTFTDSIPTNVAVSPATNTVIQGTNATYNVDVTVGGNNTACQITLSAPGLPAGSASFTNSPISTTNSYSSTLTVNTTSVAPGTYTFIVNASKPGGCNGAASVQPSTPVTLTVNSATRATTTTLARTTGTSPSTYGDSLTFTATVNSSAGSPTAGQGTVTFKDGTNAISAECSNVALNGSSQAACTTSALNVAGSPHSITAEYSGVSSGSPQFQASTSNALSQTVNKASSTTTVTCGAGPFVYDGTAKTPCSANVTGAGGLNEAVTPVNYSNNTNAGTATASATFAGDANHNGSNGSEEFTIDKASSTTTVTCPASVTYTGNPITPCSVSVTGAGGLNLSPNPNYSNNTDAGTATASYNYAGDANHNGSSDSKNFTITFNFTGFSSPVDNNNVLNTAKAGQAIPLKWRLTDASGNPVTNLSSTDVKVTVANYSCGLSTTADLLEEYAAGSSGLQNLGNGYYQFNWKTPTNYANSCKTMTLDLGEGTLTTPHTALFQFKK